MDIQRPSLSSLFRTRVASVVRRTTAGYLDPAIMDPPPIEAKTIPAAEPEIAEVIEAAPIQTRLTATELAEAAQQFSLALDAAANNEETRELWRNTNLPYGLTAQDPQSAGYKQEVLDLYKTLTGRDYSPTTESQPERATAISDPWASRDLSVAAAELAKPVQALQALAAAGDAARIVVFGLGWGNLALPLAEIGLQVTAADTDKTRLDRLAARAKRDKLKIETMHGAFVECAGRMDKTYDAVVFQSSFHHCLEFDALLQKIRESILKPDGCIYLFGEPVSKAYGFPWSLRYDGEALWSIIKNNQLELGFDEDFFITLLNRHGYTASVVPGLPGLLAPGWKASPPQIAIPFNQVALPSSYDAGFFLSDPMQSFRFCKTAASLPGTCGLPEVAQCEIHFTNILPTAISAEITAGGVTESIDLQPNASKSVLTTPNGQDIVIKSQTFVADSLVGNGDTRKLGIGIERVSWQISAADEQPQPVPAPDCEADRTE